MKTTGSTPAWDDTAKTVQTSDGDGAVPAPSADSHTDLLPGGGSEEPGVVS